MRFLEPEESATSQFSSPANDSLNTAVEPAGNSGQTQARGGFGLTNFADIQSMSDANKAQQGSPDKPKMSRHAKTAIVLTVLALLAVGGVVFGAWQLYRRGQQAQEKTSTTDKYNQQSIALDGQNQAASIPPNILSTNQQVDVNGSLQVAGSLRLVPTSRPANPIPGQQYIDATDNKLYLFNGSDWIAQLNVIDLNAVNATIQNLTVQNAAISNLVNTNAAAVSNGDALPSTVTLQGNSFNGASQLVQLTSGGLLPALDASSLTALNASNISSGSLADGRLSGNVALLNANNIFSGSNTFNGIVTANTIQPTGAMTVGTTGQSLTLQGNGSTTLSATNSGFTTSLGFAGTPSGNVNYSLVQNPAGGPGNYSICTTDGNCWGSGGGGANASLSNLSSPTAINQSLLPGAAGTIDLGSNTLPFGQLALAGTSVSPAINNYLITGASTGGTRNITLPDAAGTVALGPLTANGLLYGNGNNAAVGSVASGTTGQCLVAQTGAAPVFGSCSGAGSGSSLQAAYDNGNTISTSAGRDLLVTLANNSNFLVDIASSQTGKFAVQNAGSDLLKVTTAGGILANTDITVAQKPDAADTQYTRYKPTVSLGKPNIVTGEYTGNGSTQDVPLPAGWGTPQMVIINRISGGGNNLCYSGMVTTSKMSGGTRVKALGDGGNNLQSNIITSLGSDKFSIGSGTYSGPQSCTTAVNQNTQVYNYMAMRMDGAGDYDNYMALGSYTGNGTSQSISFGANWAPDYVLVLREGGTGTDGTVAWTTSTLKAVKGATHSMRHDGASYTNGITALNSGSFSLGSDFAVNRSSASYYYIALRAGAEYSVGCYTGTGSVRTISSASSDCQGGSTYSGPNYSPDFVLTKNDTTVGVNSVAVYKINSPSVSTTSSNVWAGQELNAITGFANPGFNLGTDTYVNALTNGPWNYYWWTAKSYTAVDTVNGYESGVVYNGKLYTSSKRTDSAEVYRYDGASWYAITPSAGQISGSGGIGKFPTMKVHGGKLFAGSDTSDASVIGNRGKAGLYFYDETNGWEQVNENLGDFGSGTTGIDSIASMAIIDGQLYFATGKANEAEIYRYNGGIGASASFTRISTGIVGKIVSGDTGNIDGATLINYQGRLYAGSKTGSATGTAALYRYDGGTSWTLLNTTPGTFQTTGAIDDVAGMIVYNGSIVIGTAKANAAEIYRYNGQGGITENTFNRISQGAGQIAYAGGSATGIDSIGALTIYNGQLLAGSDCSNDPNAAVYYFKDIDSGNNDNPGWTKLSSQADGSFGTTTGVSGVGYLIQYNDTLWAGSRKSADGLMYSISRNDLQSYGLKFIGSSDGAYDNIGSFSFVSGSQGDGNFNNHGQFLLSHTLTTSAGAYDIAEDYQTRDDELVPGDVAAIDPGSESGFVRRADLARGDGLRLLGVVSTHPAFRLSQKENFNPAAGSRTVPIALAGRVPVRIDPDSEPITAGDYLAASSKPGMAIKSTQSGGVVGKALEGWSRGGKPTVEIFVSNTFLLPGGQALSTQNTTDQIIAAGKPVTIFDAFLSTADNSLLALKNFTVFGRTIFKGETEFENRVTFRDRDMAGHAVIHKGQQEIRVKFERPYDETPVISVTPLNFIRFKVVDKSKDGFTIRVEDEVQEKVEFDWGAISIINAKTLEVTPAAETN